MRKVLISLAVMLSPGCVCSPPGEPNDDTSEPAGESGDTEKEPATDPEPKS